MAANPGRRVALANAAVDVLGRDGMRGLTHRAVDREAGVPVGTTSNYLPTRQALVDAVSEAALDRLRVPARERARLRVEPPGPEPLVRYVRACVRRCADDPAALRAWLELRVRAGRGGGSAVVAEPGRHPHAIDLAVAAERGLPGTDVPRRLLGALDGVLLAVASGASTADEAVADADALVRVLVGAPQKRWFGIR